MLLERNEVEFFWKVALFRGKCGKITVPKAATVLVKNVLDGKRRRNAPVSHWLYAKLSYLSTLDDDTREGDMKDDTWSGIPLESWLGPLYRV